MKNVNYGLARAFQLIVAVLFIYIALVYAGGILLVPLLIINLISGVFGTIGLGDTLGLAVAVAVDAYLVYVIYNTPAIYRGVLQIGVELVAMAFNQFQVFDTIAEEIKSNNG